MGFDWIWQAPILFFSIIFHEYSHGLVALMHGDHTAEEEGRLRFAILVNLSLAAFNLLPVHPLDGSKALAGLLPWRLARRYERHAPYGFLIILFLLMSGLLPRLITPLIYAGVHVLYALGLIW